MESSQQRGENQASGTRCPLYLHPSRVWEVDGGETAGLRSTEEPSAVPVPT